METKSAYVGDWPVVGHDWAVKLLRESIAARRPPHALLITGPPGVGKGTLARVMAQALLCTADVSPCGTCRACRLTASGVHPDLRWIEPDGNTLKIAQIRELTRQLTLAPMEGAWQIAVLDRFELATAGAANALLKTLEEPPATVVLILLAQQAEALLPTIVSRCQVIALRPLPRQVVEQALVARWGTSPEMARRLSHLCGGRLGWAVRASTDPTVLEKYQQRLEELGQVLRGKRHVRFAYAETLSRQPIATVTESLELWANWWRDVLLLISGSSAPLTHIDHQKELDRVARQCTPQAVLAMLNSIQTALDQLARHANTRLTLEVLLMSAPVLH